MNYKGVVLTCTQEILDDFLANLPVSIEVREFSEKYNGVQIENPTGVVEAKYYVLRVGGATFLQNHDPFEPGFAPILDANAAAIIQRHKEDLVDQIVLTQFAVKPADIIKELEDKLSQEQENNLNTMEALADVYEQLLALQNPNGGAV
ncbi:hypothetical protein [Brevibacillus choshinensis]|uniref:Uncharacterized protein n=1 Tax=Brevibacillus choshinensis TaxID=54911 RepID=A0ABX7FI05_BRECH|nr:hypothetical protein [Brevibacillus choshinensis]QRG65234.1 hypothetical protein JNE38_16455 [Brevibacillus choshinensis]